MSARAVALLCIATLAHAASYGVQKIPQFYTSSDCSGPIDPASKQWGLTATKGGMVYPFAQEGDWLQMWAFSRCITGNSTAYGIKLMINNTACANNDAANQVQLLYYDSKATACLTGLTSTIPLTLNTCVTYPLGSVKLVPQISAADLCTATDYLVKMTQGGLKTMMWSSKDCTGGVTLIQTTQLGTKDCANEPECDGCCLDYDTDTCVAGNTYTFSKSACAKNGNTWRYGMNINQYSDSGCTKKSSGVFNGKLVEISTCGVVTVNGQTRSYNLSFVPPMTIDAQCAFVEMAMRNNLDPTLVAWNQLENSAAGAVPQVLLLALLLAVALL
eukprot:TRINITY_DN20_c0_g1_i5.p1 TRINITY_DN20_c0_g1~~TRINITY_DN20_c0_g1_i5.p1  ORF type:complete len:330 (+),score=116.22 TRINITY_DN20_c0_g1_i5:57-1046(+)